LDVYHLGINRKMNVVTALGLLVGGTVSQTLAMAGSCAQQSSRRGWPIHVPKFEFRVPRLGFPSRPLGPFTPIGVPAIQLEFCGQVGLWK
jgi:hypothetical protein